jgi:S1-C subfamily serine protease
MRKLVVIGLVVIVISIVSVMPVNTLEKVTDLPPIKMLPVDYNPYQRLYDELLYPTVRINTKDGIGSGVVISATDSTDWILTASHVVENYSAVTVTFYSYRRGAEVAEEIQGSVLITDTNKDLALLRVLSVSAVKIAKLAPKDYTPFLFTPVYAVGCSLGLDPRPSSGIISAIHLSDLCVSAVEVSAPILPGNSGGPVYDANNHEIIGIAVWVKTYQGQLITTMAGIVPISEIYDFLDGVHELTGSRVNE